MGQFITNDRIDSLLKQGRVEEALHEPIKQRDPQRDGVASFVRSQASGQICLAEDAAYAGLTLGDFLYDYIRIDPEVVRGVEFARAADVDSVLSFARFADTKSDLTGASLDGLHSQLQGYVAEQIAAHHLIAQGHDVVFPGTANNPGWDLKVDGHPFQVKCLTDSGGVLEHLHRYPGIPVIVNAELANQVGDHAGVYVDPELHHDAIRHATEETLDRGRELADFEIPWISLGVSGAFNLYYMLRNDTDLEAMLTCTATDMIGRTIGGTVGKFAGGAAGFLLFGPAGVIVIGMLGATGGSATGRRVVAKGRQWFVADQEAAVDAGIRRVAKAAAEAMPDKICAWSHKSELILDSLAGSKANQTKVQRAMNRRISDHIGYWTQKKTELEAFALDHADAPRRLFERVLTLVRRAGVHAHHIQEPMTELGKKMQEYLDDCKRFRTAQT
jgi:hypothetical protein